MCLEDFRLTRIHVHFLKNWSQSHRMLLHGFHRFIDHCHLHLIPGSKAHLKLQAFNGVNAQLPFSGQNGVVLLSGKRWW